MQLRSARTRFFFAIAAVLIGATTTVASAATPSVAHARQTNRTGSLAGTWTGTLSGSANGSIHRARILIVVNARQTAGHWKLSPTCRGSLTLDSVSGGYHHYRRRVASGTSCLGGTVDCLMRVGANVYDSVTPRPGGYALTGTLHRAGNA